VNEIGQHKQTKMTDVSSELKAIKAMLTDLQRDVRAMRESATAAKAKSAATHNPVNLKWKSYFLTEVTDIHGKKSMRGGHNQFRNTVRGIYSTGNSAWISAFIASLRSLTDRGEWSLMSSQVDDLFKPGRDIDIVVRECWNIFKDNKKLLAKLEELAVTPGGVRAYNKTNKDWAGIPFTKSRFFLEIMCKNLPSEISASYGGGGGDGDGDSPRDYEADE